MSMTALRLSHNTIDLARRNWYQRAPEKVLRILGESAEGDDLNGLVRTNVEILEYPSESSAYLKS